MGSTEEDLATLWSRMCGSGKVDQGADSTLQLDSALLQLHSQLSCGSQSGQPEGGRNVLQSNLSNASSLSDLNPPRRTTSLPVPSPTNYFSANQGSSPNALQGLELSQYYSRMSSSSPLSTSSHSHIPPSGIPPLAPASKAVHSLPLHLSGIQSGSTTSQVQQLQQQAQQAIANSLKRNALGLGVDPTEDNQEATNSYLQLARLLRHHSAPSSVLGASWQNPSNGNQSLLGAQDGFLNAMFNDHLTTMSGITSDSDGAQADSGTISASFDLSRLQEDSARSAMLQRSNSLLQDQYGINEVMQLGSLDLSSPANPRVLTRQDGSLGSADFHLGLYSRDDETRKRTGLDLLAERDYLMRKRCKSPEQDYELHGRRMEDMNDHHDLVQLSHQHIPFPSHGHQNQKVNHHAEELLPENAVLCKARAKRGCATHPRSIAERVRRTKISENMKKLQELVPNIDKQANTADMLEEAVEYMKYLKHQVEILSEQKKNMMIEDEKMENGTTTTPSRSSHAESEQHLVNSPGS